MKLSETIQYINTALNYPSLTYPDIDLFFDQAVSELNTTLHTSIPTVKFMVENFRQRMSKAESNRVILATDPEDNSPSYSIPSYNVEPTTAPLPTFYYNLTDRKFYILSSATSEYVGFSVIKGVFIDEGNLRMFQGTFMGGDYAVWVEIPTDPIFECNLEEYLPDDWILLWMIPYVCFKYTVRDGGTAQTFAEELSQGFQQLQETYDVPEKVRLANYADKPAYKDLVEANLYNLNIFVKTRAIFENMKHSRNVNGIYGSFYDRGGF